MPRPPLQVGTWGKISRDEVAPGVWRAMARFRDFDGATRKVEARSTTAAKAERELLAALRDRAAPAGNDVTGDMRLNKLSEVWWEEFEELGRAYNTRRRYREVLDNYIIPGIGGIRIRECTVSAADRFLKTVKAKHGAATAKVCKTVLSGMLGLAARHDAIQRNPMAGVAAVPAARNTVRALAVEEVRALRAGLGLWQKSSKPRGRKRPQDLLDVVDVMLATGARIGEALAVRWADIDLKSDRPTLRVRATIIYKEGEGLTIQEHPKSASSVQRYFLPQFAVDMLLRRQVEQEHGNAWDVVFPSASGTLRDPNNFRKQWRSARDELGFTWVTPHTFRKSVGTILANSEGLSAASSQLGHSSEDVTSRHYVQKTHEAPDRTAILEAFGGVDSHGPI